jgi:hypothetical protein
MDDLAAIRIHESAHCIVAVAHDVPVYELVVRADATGQCLFRDLDRDVDDARAALARLRLYLSGPEAEAYARADYSYGSRPVSSSDELAAEDSAKRLARLRPQDGGWRGILRSERMATRRLIERTWPSIAALASSLELNGAYLSGADLAEALKAAGRGQSWGRPAPLPTPSVSLAYARSTAPPALAEPLSDLAMHKALVAATARNHW